VATTICFAGAGSAEFTRQLVRDPNEADDLVSESFAKILQVLRGGGGPDAAFRAYLYTTVRRVAYDRTKAVELQKKLKKNEFDLEDFKEQLTAVKKMGSMVELIGMIPGVKKLFKGAELDGAEGELKRIEAIINSMTKQERRNHLILNASRRKRIATGSGTSVAEVNRLIKQFEQTRKVMKKLGSAPQMMRGMGLPGMFR